MTDISFAAAPSFVAQIALPSASDRAVQTTSSPALPVANTRPPATDTGATPSPRPVAFQAKGGPPSGHSFNRPVSAETLVRAGPRHCGQSAAGRGTAASSPAA